MTLRRYHFNDGKFIEASSPEEFVQKMRNASYSESENTQAFMQACSERGRKLGLDIRFDNEDNFLADLIHSGYVTIESLIQWN